MPADKQKLTINNFYLTLLQVIRYYRSSPNINVFSDRVEFTQNSETSHHVMFQDLINLPTVERNWFFKIITIHTEIKSYRLYVPKTSPLFILPDDKLLGIRKVAKFFDMLLIGHKQQFSLLADKEYLRDSSIPKLDCMIRPLVSAFEENRVIWTEYLSSDSVNWLNFAAGILPLEANAEVVRQSYEQHRLNQRKYFYDLVESNPLTLDQRLSIVRENDRNMILAAAGTGKTSVMVAKALDLIDSGQLKPSEILLLAYNNAAAKELSDRLRVRAKMADVTLSSEPQISTFHALGRKVLQSSGISTHISVLAEDPQKFDKWVHDWLVNYVSSSSVAMKNFIAIHYRPADPFEFTDQSEYERYIRDNEYRALSGDLVRGYQELLIANFLYLNGVSFSYEPQYITKARVDIGYDYRPDFYFDGTNIYLEHFGISRDGGTAPGIDKVAYNEGIANKRKLHREHNTVLLETFHYQWTEGVLEDSLKAQLLEHKIELSPIDPKDVYAALNESGVIDNGAKILQKSLSAIRVEQLSDKDIIDRLKASHVPHANRHASILQQLHHDYVDFLGEQNAIDFDDMIIRSCEAINLGQFHPTWKFVLVDEFQDISQSRSEMLKQIIEKGPNPKLTVVGDDWQSIYRFSGGKLELTTRFDSFFGHKTLTKLEKTFRYNNSIADTAGKFIMQNNEQYKKHIKTHTQVEQSQIFLYDSHSPNQKNGMAMRTAEIVKMIKQEDSTGSIAILGRYNFLLNEAREELKREKLANNVKFWSFHGSKGLEADYCILIGFLQGKLGFPSDNVDHEVVGALLPSLDTYPHSEERRLMYVALTRAKHKSFLIADPTARSSFISELLEDGYDINIESQRFKSEISKAYKCPFCTDGYYQQYKGKYGMFYRCSSGSACKSKPRVCKTCGFPQVDGRKHSKCLNDNCQESLALCSKCARPMKLRTGPYGSFYGCTGYGLKNDPCSNKEKVAYFE
ncbi:hypothetical protein VHA01S_030_00610 [Vibrio halioticoli NBRC 102217]|uniref:DNA 3'-5' helicase n=1 Tax=Vibrio halioticoli NBRC 102217 TaxID=1219072 RepID=V5FJR1_9VIBR|nr:UvrD-helicase domain-containing protein [Vibrio halioticoli]GAD89986.1 hypothetical protein VHA01S_030_00610 [Vibrio halioticoli NBRC 102217]